MRPIDADALKDKARELIPNYHVSVVMNLFDLIDNLADNMPTIERRGRWIYDIDDQGWSWDAPFKCDQCGKWNNRCTAYCPNCGVMMNLEGDIE